MDRVFVIGNGGSGKTWLAEKLSEELSTRSVHLDDLHWLPNFAGERPRSERDRLVDDVADSPSWNMEGIYGSVLMQVFARVTTLIWLDLSIDECLSNLMDRGQTGGGTEEQFEELLDYTRAYHDRQNLNSYEGHRRLFAEFGLPKFKLSNRADTLALLLRIKEGHSG
ncbi:AAA family ATPase [Devosia sp.]|uniref:AAA family ATPase n=1 Tax=Devosia sp. TaxID=1871048 RepID=UPI001ACE6EB6|nr:AAA family ATPase [Devosia sp.]MBN9333925.1 AAA family ATPase [Devosia sp.]